MVQEVLKSIEGVALFPLLGLLLCLGGFVVMLLAVWRMRSGDVDYISRLPLDDTTQRPATREPGNGGGEIEGTRS